jgi:hypothetical protein
MNPLKPTPAAYGQHDQLFQCFQCSLSGVSGSNPPAPSTVHPTIDLASGTEDPPLTITSTRSKELTNEIPM